ncbi:pyridoxamine 5'-phosphate oxidase family protein [Bacillus alveayuensis]|uniref:Pyridoxamine 5'-phosphate oxidase family protein n=1 Tax=Aeribacillus alveayuensis TaxID=279215 RepID=A0ABT9VPJ7_9BACI|nr:pyridoxamine 5'-phosphate oxidase family protein [Bacillus alveayuensis]MDQ0162814.1 putative pyridoxamine 5'-phosphate oxidase family protein [Bacillus alveayuensis]
MANKVETVLIEPLFKSLQQEHFVTVATIDYETGAPNVSAISWVYAPDEKRIYFAVDNRSRIVKNIHHHPATVITLITNESTYSISGNAHVKKEKLDEVPLKLALIELNISEVRDVMFYGAKISVEPAYVKTYDEKAAARLDKQVMDVMKKA